MATKKKADEIHIVQFERGHFTCCVLGTTPIILNRMSQKAMQELLFPSRKKNAAARASTLKHDPIAEYRASAYRSPNEEDPTYLQHLSSAFKGALRGAALDMPGTAKSQIGRLVRVEGERIGIYGLPKLHMSIVRSANMNKTPDVRTRAIVPEWACYVTVSFTKPLLNQKSVINLLAAAGQTQGIGDWRPEKGSGTYGQFELVDEKDPRFVRIIEMGGRQAQIDALKSPVCYDEETEELLGWFENETVQRGITATTAEDELEDIDDPRAEGNHAGA